MKSGSVKAAERRAARALSARRKRAAKCCTKRAALAWLPYLPGVPLSLWHGLGYELETLKRLRQVDAEATRLRAHLADLRERYAKKAAEGFSASEIATAKRHVRAALVEGAKIRAARKRREASQ